jgi:hypothetical protein
VSARAALVAVLVGLAIGGCGGSDDSKTGAGNPPPKPAPSPAAADAAVIRGWTRATYAGNYERAGSYFAPGAIVQQAETFVLGTHQDAVSFSRSLPCRAKVTGIERESRGVLLASFDLFPGRDGRCPKGGSARVRFGIHHGLIEAWHQLPEAPAPEGQST